MTVSKISNAHRLSGRAAHDGVEWLARHGAVEHRAGRVDEPGAGVLVTEEVTSRQRQDGGPRCRTIVQPPNELGGLEGSEGRSSNQRSSSSAA